MSDQPLRIWAVSDGRAGMENQVVGLAEAIGRQVSVQITKKRLAIKPPFDLLPHRLWGDPFARLAPSADRLDPPYPDLWIGCGRRTLAFSQALKGKGPFVVQTQDPRISEAGFDLVIPPAHDMLRGPNVFPILGSPNRLTAQRLADDAAILEPILPALPRPLASVLIGGNSKAFRLSATALDQMISTLRDVTASGMGLLITTSRRTGDANRAKIKAALAGSRAWVWDGTPVEGMGNPYFGMLGLADRHFVTEESANMVTDAAFTGRPVHLLKLTGGAPKWTLFHHSLEQRGVIQPQKSYKDDWTYPAIRETDRAASEVLARMGWPNGENGLG